MANVVLYADIPEELKEWVIDKAKDGSISQALFVTAMISYCKERELDREIVQFYDDYIFPKL